MKIWKRNQKMYTDIEQFTDYELTQSVVYEMAIRTKPFKDIFEKITKRYNETNMYGDSAYEVKSEIRDLCDEVGITLDSYLALKDHLILVPTIKIFEKIMKLVQDNKKTLDKTERTMYEDDLGDVHISEIINRDGYEIKNEISAFADTLYEHHDGGYTVGGCIGTVEKLRERLEENKNMHTVLTLNTITPKFSRPELTIKHLHKRRVSVLLNLSLPIYEINEYLKHVIEDIQKTQNLVKSPIELLGDDLLAADEFKYLSKKSSEKQFQLANMFYIYDAFEAKMKQSQIKGEIYNYQESFMEERTIKNFYELAKKYIDEECYMDLVTGTKTNL